MRFIPLLLLVACSSSSSTSSPPSTTPSNDTSTAIAAECLEGGAGVTTDGWTSTIGNDAVSTTKGNVGVAIVYALTIDDELRSASHFAEGVWDKLLGPDFTAGTRTSGGDGTGLLAYASGTATEKASGKTVFVTVTADRNNGIAFPVIAIAPDEATMKATLATPDAISSMRRYNFFPLSCTGIVGTWSTSSLTANDTNAGIKVSSLQLDLTLSASSTYMLDAKVSTNTGSEQEHDTGSYTSAAQELAFTSNAGFRNKTFDAGFVAVKGGVGLYVVDRAFAGDAWLLFRK